MFSEGTKRELARKKLKILAQIVLIFRKCFVAFLIG